MSEKSQEVPGSAAKLKGVIRDVPLTVTMDELTAEVKGGGSGQSYKAAKAERRC